MTTIFLALSILAFVLAAIATPLVKKIAWRTGCVDVPRPPRNLHRNSVAKLGGLAVYTAFTFAVLAYWWSGGIHPEVVPAKFIAALLLGGLVLVVGGFFDDKYDLSPKILWLFPALAALIVIWSGIGVGITFLTNPLGGIIPLDFVILGIPASAMFIFVWLNGMMYTTKFLDGLDGLVAGIGVIAGLTLFALSLTEKVNQPITASFALILVGALAGYLLYAKYPASIFLGEGGSTLVGFILGVLSVILGAKIATALLVMGVPILDVAYVILQRLWHRKSPFVGDRLHLHFRLIDLGYTQKQTAFILYLVSAVFGFSAVLLQSTGKLIAFGMLVAVMIGLVGFLVYGYKHKRAH